MKDGLYLKLFGVLLLGACALYGSASAQTAVEIASSSGEDANQTEPDVTKDPTWKTTHHETGSFRVGTAGAVNNFCVNAAGNLLVCGGGDRVDYSYDPSTRKTKTKTIHALGEISTFSPSGKKLTSWKVPIKPGAICVDGAGSIYVGGDGQVLKLNSSGQIVQKAKLPAQDLSKVDKSMREYLKTAGREVTGLAVTNQDVFVATMSPTDYSYVVYRLSKTLKAPKLIVTQLSGCCGQMDIQANNGDLWVAHNAKHLVERYSRSGKKLSSFGRYDRSAADGFGGCCEPKNLRFVGKYLYAAESGPPTCIKKYTPSGIFMGVVAVADYKTGCVRATIEPSKDGSKFYMFDPDGGLIHIMSKK